MFKVSINDQQESLIVLETNEDKVSSKDLKALKRFPHLFYITLDNGFTEFHCSRAIMGYAPASIEY